MPIVVSEWFMILLVFKHTNDKQSEQFNKTITVIDSWVFNWYYKIMQTQLEWTTRYHSQLKKINKAIET